MDVVTPSYEDAPAPVTIGPRPRPHLVAERLRLFVCVDHDVHVSVGAASVVVAANEAAARELLDEQLVERGLLPHDAAPYTLKELPLDRPYAEVLVDGNY